MSQAVCKLPPNLGEQWSMHTVTSDMLRPTLIDFNNWLKRKAEAHERMNAPGTNKLKNDEAKSRTSSKSLAVTGSATTPLFPNPSVSPRKLNPESKLLPCPECKGKHPLWMCDDFKAKSPTQRAKLAAENNFCFRCVNGVHKASECDNDIQCTSPNCESPRQHNTLLHCANRIFPLRQKQKTSDTPRANNPASANVQRGNKSTCSYAVADTDTRGLIPVARVRVTSNSKSEDVLALCDTGSVHSWISDKLAKRLALSGYSVKIALSGIRSDQFLKTERVQISVSSVHADPQFSFDLKPFTKSLKLGNELIDIPELQRQHPQLAPIPPLSTITRIFSSSLVRTRIMLFIKLMLSRVTLWSIRGPSNCPWGGLFVVQHLSECPLRLYQRVLKLLSKTSH